MFVAIYIIGAFKFIYPVVSFSTAESSLELSRREQEGQQVFSEDDLRELIMGPGNSDSVDQELIYTSEEIEKLFESVFIPLTQKEKFVEEDLLELAPEATRHIKLGTDNRYSWFALGELEAITLEAHTSESGVIINLSKSYHSPKIYLPLLMKEDELLDIKASSGTLEDLLALLGEAEVTSIRDGGLPTYYWYAVGGEEIPAGDIVQLEIQTNSKGEIQDLNYRLHE